MPKHGLPRSAFPLRRAACDARNRAPVVLVIFRFHEELGERRMCHVRTSVVQTHFGIACEFENSFPGTAVFNPKGANFRIGMWCHAYRPRNLDVPGATAEFGPVTMETVLVGVPGRENGLIFRWTKARCSQDPERSKTAPSNRVWHLRATE